MDNQAKNKKGISLSTQILIGLIIGLLTGLFFGDKASALAIVGKAYIGLIQMSILPYMVVSLMLGIGSLSYEKARNLAITGGIVWLQMEQTSGIIDELYDKWILGMTNAQKKSRWSIGRDILRWWE